MADAFSRGRKMPYYAYADADVCGHLAHGCCCCHAADAAAILLAAPMPCRRLRFTIRYSLFYAPQMFYAADAPLLMPRCCYAALRRHADIFHVTTAAAICRFRYKIRFCHDYAMPDILHTYAGCRTMILRRHCRLFYDAVTFSDAYSQLTLMLMMAAFSLFTS